MLVLLYCSSGITVPRRTSHVCLYNSWHLGKVWLASIILLSILDTPFKFWHQRKGSILAGWRFASNGETVKNPNEVARFLYLTPFAPESTRNKVSFSDYSFTFVPVAQQVLFLCESCINFLHFELLPPLLHQFPLFESHFSLNLRKFELRYFPIP